MKSTRDRLAVFSRSLILFSVLPLSVPAASSHADDALVPSGTWRCGIGYGSSTSYQQLVTSGNSYTVSWDDGSGKSSTGTIVLGTHTPIQDGTPLLFTGGGWDGYRGEFAPAGTVTNPLFPPIGTDQIWVDGGVELSYYPGSCTPK